MFLLIIQVWWVISNFLCCTSVNLHLDAPSWTMVLNTSVYTVMEFRGYPAALCPFLHETSNLMSIVFLATTSIQCSFFHQICTDMIELAVLTTQGGVWFVFSLNYCNGKRDIVQKMTWVILFTQFLEQCNSSLEKLRAGSNYVKLTILYSSHQFMCLSCFSLKGILSREPWTPLKVLALYMTKQVQLLKEY